MTEIPAAVREAIQRCKDSAYGSEVDAKFADLNTTILTALAAERKAGMLEGAGLCSALAIRSDKIYSLLDCATAIRAAAEKGETT